MAATGSCWPRLRQKASCIDAIRAPIPRFFEGLACCCFAALPLYFPHSFEERCKAHPRLVAPGSRDFTFATALTRMCPAG